MADHEQNRKPLTEAARAVYELLLEQPETKGMTGREIVQQLHSRKLGVTLDEDKVRGSIRRELLPYGLKNDRGARGYYIPLSSRPTARPAQEAEMGFEVHVDTTGKSIWIPTTWRPRKQEP